MAVLALLIVPALVLEDRVTDPRLREAAHILNWIVCVIGVFTATVASFSSTRRRSQSWRRS